MEDAKIVALYWERDESAIAQTDRKYGRYLKKIAYNILSDPEDSMESVNDTYLGAWNSMPPHKPQVLSTYLSKLTRRISIDMLRRKCSLKRGAGEYVASLSELRENITDSNTTEQAVDVKMLAEAIEAFLRGLTPDQRNTFIGRYYYMDPVKEVARYCGMTEAKVKSLLFRTRCALREYLQKEGFLP